MDRYKGVVDRLKGPVVPLNICFTAEGTIDYPAQRRYVNWLCEQGVPVILLTYGSSEFSLLGDEDLWRLSAEMAAEVAGRALMIGSTSYWNVATCRKFLQHAEESGLDGVKVQMNPWMGQTDPAVFIAYHDQIQDAAPIPLLLWCNSGGGGGVPIDAVAELARRPQVVGVKNDEDPFGYYYNLIRATSDEDFAVISGGQMRNIAFGYQVGSPAYLCTIAPFRPDIALEFYGLLVAGDYDAAWQMVFRYEDAWLTRAGELEWLFSIKTAIHLHGLFPEHHMAPLRGQDSARAEQVRACLEEVFGAIKPAI